MKPNIDTENVVFVESPEEIDAKDRIKLQIKEHLDEILKVGIVKELSTKGIPYTIDAAKKAASNVAKNFMGGVQTLEFGTVYFNEDSISDIESHGKTYERFIACMAIPQILKRGTKIFDYSDENKKTITISAPIKIDGETVIVAVIVSENNRTVYGLNLTDEHGEKYSYKKSNATPTVYALGQNESAPPTINGVASTVDDTTDNKKSQYHGEDFSEKNLMSDRDTEYLELSNATVTVNPNMSNEGEVSPFSTDSIYVKRLGTGDSTKRIILHEIQHLIQNSEGFARGSSPKMFTYKEWGARSTKPTRSASR